MVQSDSKISIPYTRAEFDRIEFAKVYRALRGSFLVDAYVIHEGGSMPSYTEEFCVKLGDDLVALNWAQTMSLNQSMTLIVRVKDHKKMLSLMREVYSRVVEFQEQIFNRLFMGECSKSLEFFVTQVNKLQGLLEEESKKASTVKLIDIDEPMPTPMNVDLSDWAFLTPMPQQGSYPQQPGPIQQQPEQPNPDVQKEERREVKVSDGRDYRFSDMPKYGDSLRMYVSMWYEKELEVWGTTDNLVSDGYIEIWRDSDVREINQANAMNRSVEFETYVGLYVSLDGKKMVVTCLPCDEIVREMLCILRMIDEDYRVKNRYGVIRGWRHRGYVNDVSANKLCLSLLGDSLCLLIKGVNIVFDRTCVFRGVVMRNGGKKRADGGYDIGRQLVYIVDVLFDLRGSLCDVLISRLRERNSDCSVYYIGSVKYALDRGTQVPYMSPTMVSMCNSDLRVSDPLECKNLVQLINNGRALMTHEMRLSDSSLSHLRENHMVPYMDYTVGYLMNSCCASGAANNVIRCGVVGVNVTCDSEQIKVACSELYMSILRS